MIKQFRSLNPVNIFLLLIIAMVLRSGVFLHLPQTPDLNLREMMGWMLINMSEKAILSPLANVTIAAILTIIQAVILNRIINNHNILGKPTFLPALMYVTISSIFLPFIVLNPVIICNFLVVWMISKFLNIYHKDGIGAVMYDLGMIVGAGTVIYFPFIAMMPLLWISLIIFRPFNWREWIATILGFITVCFFLAVFYYMNDSFDKFYEIWLPLTNKFPTDFNINLYDYIVLFPVVFIILLAILSLRENFFRSFVHVRKSFLLLFYMFFLAMISFYLRPHIEIYHFLLGLSPVSILMAYYFLNAGKAWFYETVYLLLVGFVIYFQWV